MLSDFRPRVERDFAELSEHYGGLQLLFGDSDAMVVGILSFSADYAGIVIEDSFSVEITIPGDYPGEQPSAKERAGRIPDDFHRLSDGSMCLGTPLDVEMTFAGGPDILGFVNNLVVPYLFSFCCQERHGIMPFGERPHGAEGILDHYCELLNASQAVTVDLLSMLAGAGYRGHELCRCGSGRKLRKCHGAAVLRLKERTGHHRLVDDLILYLLYLKRTSRPVPVCLQDERLRRRIEDRLWRLAKTVNVRESG